MNNFEFNCFLYGNEYPIVKWEKKDKIEFWVEQQEDVCSCPECGWESCKVHDVHPRRIQDTPIHNKNVYIHIDVREFRCKNKNCNVKTFTEELPFAGKNQVRTYDLTQFILIHAIYMSSNSTSLILSFLGIDVSADTVDNILKKVVIKDDPEVEMIGIDDISTRKGMKYATAIYNLETHHLIALLEGREKEDIIPWLKAHPKIIIVARDRASAYAKAIDEILPNAVQIADRFHLFENLIKYLKDLFYSEIPDKIVIKNSEIKDKATKVLKELANINETILNKLNYTNDKPIDEDGNIIDFIDYEYNLSEAKYQKQAENRQKKYNDIISIRNESNLSIEQLKVKYGYSTSTIKKYLTMTDEEVEKVKQKKNYNRKKETEFSKYKNIVYKMLMDNQPYEYIIAYVLKSGFNGPIIRLKDKIWKLAKNNKIEGIKFTHNRYVYSDDEIIITRLELLKYILTINEKKLNNNDIKDNLELIESHFPKVKEIKTIYQDFHNVIFSKDEETLDIFIELYKNILPSFCNGLKKDIAAVKNAISDSINSGFVEGNNNKIKLIKRIVYGKKKLVNLFKRCYLAFASTLEDLSLLKIAISSLI